MPLESQILVLRNGQFEQVKADFRESLRCACWTGNGDRALLVGDRGTILHFDGERFERIPSHTKENLRGVAYSSRNGALIVGNHGTLLLLAEDGRIRSIEAGVDDNLRRVAWSPEGSGALAIGNSGAVISWDGNSIKEIGGALNNLRGISWNPSEDYALVSGNYFAQSMVPCPTLYRYERGAAVLTRLGTTEKTDLISLDWKPDGNLALLAGYEVVWHEPRMYTWSGGKFLLLPLREPGLFPTVVAWHPEGDYAIVGTGSPDPPGKGGGTILKYSEDGFTHLFSSEYRTSCISWRHDGSSALIMGTRTGRTFTA